MKYLIPFLALVAVLTLVAPPAQAASASATFQTEEGYALTVTRKGRQIAKMALATGTPSEDIKCNLFFYFPPLALGQHFLTASVRSRNASQYGDVVPFLLTAEMPNTWVMMPNTCAIGINAGPDTVSVTLANMGKMGGRAFTLTPEVAQQAGDFIKKTY